MASRIDGIDFDRLATLANPDTWIGPAATEYRHVLAGHRSALVASASDLRSSAYTLDRRADIIDEERRRAALLPPK